MMMVSRILPKIGIKEAISKYKFTVVPRSLFASDSPISLKNIIMCLFEWLVYKNKVSTVCTNHIDLDQFAYRNGHKSGFVSIFSFDFSKAFHSVSHRILVSKPGDVDINPYILNWLISFISNRKQQVVVDNITTEY